MQNENSKRYEIKDVPCLFHGRLAKDGAPNLFWGGSGIEFTLCASECFLELYAEWQSSEETVRVTVDGFEVARAILMPGVTTLPVFLKLNPEVRRTVRLYKEHQAWDTICGIQIPHHGSKYNYHPALYEGCYYAVASAGTSNKYRHPNAKTLDKIYQQKCVPFVVTEDSPIRFEQYIHF